MFSYTNARRQNLFQQHLQNKLLDVKKIYKRDMRHGNLDSVRTFVDIDDAMEAYWLCATKGKVGEIYNICGDKVISVRYF